MHSPLQMATAEARRLAHNASSLRSYAKHRESINKKRRDTYRKKNGGRNGSRLESESPVPRQAVPSVQIEVSGGRSYTEHTPPLAHAMIQINRISASFTTLTEGSPRRYANTVYQRFATLGDNPLRSAVLQVSFLEKALLEQERVILNSPSITGNEIGRLRAVLGPVRLLAGWLEEMVHEAMLSPDGLKERYFCRELAFMKDG